MKFSAAIEAFIADWQAEGRLNGPNSDLAYRRTLNAHCDDVANRDPAKTTKADVKRTLRRWPNPNSRRLHHSVMRTFYDWCTQEDIRIDNPARQIRDTKRREPVVFRPTRDEVVRLMAASMGRTRDRWTIHLGVLAGIRNQEFRGLQGRHLSRDGFVWVSADIAKGGKERFVPVLPELVPIVAEIRMLVELDRYVLGTLVTRDPPHNSRQVPDDTRSISASGLTRLVARIGQRAGMPTRITPHTLRHAFGDHVARFAGLRAAQHLMGHASVETTAGTYTDRPTLDELAVSVQGFSYSQHPYQHDPTPLVAPETPHRNPDAR